MLELNLSYRISRKNAFKGASVLFYLTLSFASLTFLTSPSSFAGHDNTTSSHPYYKERNSKRPRETTYRQAENRFIKDASLRLALSKALEKNQTELEAKKILVQVGMQERMWKKYFPTHRSISHETRLKIVTLSVDQFYDEYLAHADHITEDYLINKYLKRYFQMMIEQSIAHH